MNAAEQDRFSIETSLNTFNFAQKVRLQLQVLRQIVVHGGNITKHVFVPSHLFDLNDESN